MDILFAFIIATVISFFGSVLLGLVNVAVIDTAINKSSKSALWLAFGGVLPEIPYVLIAVIGTAYVDQLAPYKQFIGIGVGIILLFMGLSNWFKKSTPKEVKVSETGALAHFGKGFLLALANPQLIFFWSTVLLLLQVGTFTGGSPLINFEASGIISPKISFALGAPVGAFLILYLYVRLSAKYKEKLTSLIGDKMNKSIGLVFIAIGIFTIIKNVI